MEIKYKLKELVEENYRYNYDFDYSSINMEQLEFQFSHALKADKPMGEISFVFLVKVLENESQVELVENSVRTTFEVEPYDAAIGSMGDDGLQVKEPVLIDTFANVTIGALRGMLAKNLKGTPLDKCVLPLLPMSMIRKNMESKNKGKKKQE